ncbi:MAG: ABC transporter, permease protein (cluster 3, basic aa/glutamine/opines), partial [uncultured Solirubrobacteraceae bacterium]
EFLGPLRPSRTDCAPASSHRRGRRCSRRRRGARTGRGASGRGGPVRSQDVGVPHRRGDLRGDLGGTGQHAAGGGGGHRPLAGLRRSPGRGAVVAAGPVALAGHRDHRVLPRRAAAAPDPLRLPRLRQRHRALLVAGGRARPLQRVGAGRGLPGRHPGGPARAARGGLRHRPARLAGHAAGAGAAGGEGDAAGDHLPERGRAQGQRPRPDHRLRGARPRRAPAVRLLQQPAGGGRDDRRDLRGDQLHPLAHRGDARGPPATGAPVGDRDNAPGGDGRTGV